MGYEIRIHVVAPHTFLASDQPQTGSELAVLDLCKCGYDGAVSKVVQKAIDKAKKSEGPGFALWPNNPDRQQEATEFLREVAECDVKSLSMNKEAIDKLSNDIEDGYITKDRYGEPLGVIELDEFIAALEEDNKAEPYRRFQWALALLKSIKETHQESTIKVVTYGH
jgi:hypothetical protein